MKLIAEVDFNWDDDKKEFSIDDKVVRVYRSKDAEGHKVSFCFELGRKEDDTLNLTFGLAELLTAVATCEKD